MAYKLEEINLKTISDPAGFIAEGDAAYAAKVSKAADMITANLKNSPIVLLSGPSGSGKTTTARKISEELSRRGVGTHYISMDDYYKDLNPETSPRTPEGDYDFESPDCLDLELLSKHFSILEQGGTADIPAYDFKTASRMAEPSKSITLKKDEAVVVEGIHALNDLLTVPHSEAFKLYISARSDVTFNDVVVFKRTWFRLTRRMVRDYNFRGASAEETMTMWANVRRGEKAHISPFKNKADYQFDTSLCYELPVMNATASKLFSTIPEGIERFDELKEVYRAILLFGDIDQSLVPKDSLIREFIGGGLYD